MARYQSKQDTSIEIAASDTPTQVIEKLKNALTKDGDFPARAQMVSELRRLTRDPNTVINEVVDVIMRDATVATRVLHVVNSSMYQRIQSITTVSQAVMQLGMGPLAELCSGLILVEKFLPSAKKGGPFADNVKKSILVSVITSYLLNRLNEKGLAEQGFLAATFHSLGYLLLAYYFPQVFEAAGKRAERRRHDITQSITEILGVSPMELGLAVLDTLEIPEYYRNIVKASYKSYTERGFDTPEDKLANALAVAEQLSSLITAEAEERELEDIISDLSKYSHYSKEALEELIRITPELFGAHCRMVDMTSLELPEYLSTFALRVEEEVVSEELTDESDKEFAEYIEEIRESIANHEPISSIVTTAMEALVFVLEYDRALLLLADRSGIELNGRLAIGESVDFDPQQITRDLSDHELSDAPDVLAFKNGHTIYAGKPLFEHAQHHAAIPIGGKTGMALGVIYADVVSQKACNRGQQRSLITLGDLLRQAAEESQEFN